VIAQIPDSHGFLLDRPKQHIRNGGDDVMNEDYQSQVRLQGKIALVTGAGRGLDKWIAKGLALAGAEVAVSGLHLENVQQTAKEIEQMHGKAYPVQVDLRQIDSIRKMVQDVKSTFGRIGCLVNNAGVNIHKPFFAFSPEDFDHMSSVNFRAVYFTSQLVSKEMASDLSNFITGQTLFVDGGRTVL
jgi:NAD(P)-dependent dehydrogenase (short-subunit alcohol dehydrogenase family)